MTRLKLQGVHDGRLYATRGRTVYEEVAASTLRFEPRGRFPVPTSGIEGAFHRVRTTHPWKGALERVVGAFQTTNVWRIDGDLALGTAGRWLFRSVDGGRTWRAVRTLPESSSQMGVLPTGLCVHDGRIYLGEYPLDTDATPRVLASDDGGATWEPILHLPDVRHVHALQVDPYSDDLWLTTGDRNDESHIGRLRDGEFAIVGGGDQRWRAVELAFTPDAVLWGMDCVYADEKWIFSLDRDEIDRDGPAPRPVHSVPHSVYYGETLTVEGTQWVVFATGMEAGGDSTGPDEQAVDVKALGVVVASSAESDFGEWHRLASYRRRSSLADRIRSSPLPTQPLDVKLPTANAYVLLAVDPDRGLFLNPYNTTTDDRRIRLVTNERFERLGRRREWAGDEPSTRLGR